MSEALLKPTFLLLRPFWEPDITAEYLGVICQATKRLGDLVAIKNGAEEIKLKPKHVEETSKKGSNLWAKVYEYFHRPLNIELVEATDETWQAEAIRQIRRADVVLVHLAPRKGDGFSDFEQFEPNRTPRTYIEFSSNPVHEVGTGQGLLRELDYCEQAEALHKVIALIPSSFYPRIQEALQLLEVRHAANSFKRTEAGLVPVIPKISALDRSLEGLKDVHSIVVYPKFGGRVFNFVLRKALESCLAEPRRSQQTSESSLLKPGVGIPSEPVALPPDGKLKRIRFTPIESLTVIPTREIVELSFDEVKEMHPDITYEPYTCPGCGRDPEFIFWFQNGLEVEISKDAWIFQLCQYCGHDDYIIPWNESVRRGYIKEH